MTRTRKLYQQERNALKTYETLIRRMTSRAREEEGSVRPLGPGFAAAMAELEEATQRIAQTHVALVAALEDGERSGGADVSAEEREDLDARRQALLTEGNALMALLRERRRHMGEELGKLRGRSRPAGRNPYREGNRPSIIDVSG